MKGQRSSLNPVLMTRPAILLLLLASPLAAQPAPDGAALYARLCARCHDAGGQKWAPPLRELRGKPPEHILAAMVVGIMAPIAPEDTPSRRAIAEFVAAKRLPPDTTLSPAPTVSGLCTAGAAPMRDPGSGPRWIGWGVDSDNSRFQPAAMAELKAEDVPRLRLKWAFGFPGVPLAFGHPSVAGGRIFVGSASGLVYSLDAGTGCVHWTFQAAPDGVRGALTVAAMPGTPGRIAVWFGDLAANVYALDAATGRQIWKTRLDDFPTARATGSPVLHNGRIYIGVASFEELLAANPKYECCRFRGSIAALDARTGAQIWKTFTIADPAKPTGKNHAGTPAWGPSGAGVWSAPTIDGKAKALYVTTGDGYSDPAASTSDAILALDLDRGKILWTRQFTRSDQWNLSCVALDKVGCPPKPGGDFDFGSSAILRTLPSGKRLLIAGQKSGMVHAIDPDRGGEIVWQSRAGRGDVLGGVEWGPAADAERVYVAVSDLNPSQPETGGGLFALRISNGERQWQTMPPRPTCGSERGCTAAQPGARDPHSRRGLFRLAGRPPPRLFQRHRQDDLGGGHA
jgi:polyvinyl alcohol dehydrogenase (cytochrome)